MRVIYFGVNDFVGNQSLYILEYEGKFTEISSSLIVKLNLNMLSRIFTMGLVAFPCGVYGTYFLIEADVDQQSGILYYSSCFTTTNEVNWRTLIYNSLDWESRNTNFNY